MRKKGKVIFLRDNDRDKATNKIKLYSIPRMREKEAKPFSREKETKCMRMLKEAKIHKIKR